LLPDGETDLGERVLGESDIGELVIGGGEPDIGKGWSMEEPLAPRGGWPTVGRMASSVFEEHDDGEKH
jgi:hypothetical protein